MVESAELELMTTVDSAASWAGDDDASAALSKASVDEDDAKRGADVDGSSSGRDVDNIAGSCSELVCSVETSPASVDKDEEASASDVSRSSLLADDVTSCSDVGVDPIKRDSDAELSPYGVESARVYEASAADDEVAPTDSEDIPLVDVVFASSREV